MTVKVNEEVDQIYRDMAKAYARLSTLVGLAVYDRLDKKERFEVEEAKADLCSAVGHLLQQPQMQVTPKMRELALQKKRENTLYLRKRARKERLLDLLEGALNALLIGLGTGFVFFCVAFAASHMPK